MVDGNFENLNQAHHINYERFVKVIPTFTEVLTPRLLTIGKLQLLRRIVTNQI
jgi:hypothetical protein